MQLNNNPKILQIFYRIFLQVFLQKFYTQVLPKKNPIEVHNPIADS